MDDQSYRKEQAKRCRRLARQINDPSARNALERLAKQYDASLNPLLQLQED